jgi:hypothetical protein
LLCLNRVYYPGIIYKEHKHYKFIKLEIVYKSNQDQAEKIAFVLDRESITQRRGSALI